MLLRHIGSIALLTLFPFLSHSAFLDLSTGSQGFSNTPNTGLFTDTFNFTLTTPSVFSSSLTTAVSGFQDVDLMSVTVSGPSGSSSFSRLLGDPFETWGLLNATLSPGL